MTVQQIEKLILSRIVKSKKYLIQAEQVFKFEFYDNCINRVYYSCFYMVIALLLKNGFKPKTHAGVKILLSKHFSNELSSEMLKFFSELSKLRSIDDYDADVDFDKDIAPENLAAAKIFLPQIEKLIMQQK